MSQFGKKAIYLPQLLKIEVQTYKNGQLFWISGPNATLFRSAELGNSNTRFVMKNLHLLMIQNSSLNYAQDFYQLLKTRARQKKKQWAGLWQGQLQRTMISASSGYKKYLILRGVGYKFQKKNRILTLQIGYSHQMNILIPSDIEMKWNRKWTAIRCTNSNDAFLHGWLSSVKNIKKPDVYKGKGIRYKKETVIRKEGKKKKTF